MQGLKRRSRQRAVWAALIVAFAVISAVGQAALPKKGGHYRGAVTASAVGPVEGPGIYDAEFVFKVSSTGRRLLFSFPPVCGRNRRAVINKIEISDRGTFSGKRTYKEVRESIYFYNWSVKVSGKFVSKTRAKGHLTIVLRFSSSRGGRGAGERICKSPKNTPWTAKHVFADS